MSKTHVLMRIAKPKTQGGVALVLAMMIVTLIAIIATEISWRFELSTSRSGNRWAGIQARAYIEGAEQLAMVVLREDAEGDETKESDHLNEAWHQRTQFPTDHGSLEGEIFDAQGRFNINLMVQAAGACPNDAPPDDSGTCRPPGSTCDDYTDAQRVFIRLLRTFNIGVDGEEQYLEQQQAQEITEAVIDWLDSDSNIRGFGGAESDYYDQLNPPVAIKNGEMASVSELLVIKGMVPQLYDQLVEHVIALPKDEVGRIHINTATEPVLRSLRWEDKSGGNNNSVNNCDLSPIGSSQNSVSNSQSANLNSGVAGEDENQNSGLQGFMRSNEFESINDLTSHPDLPYDWTQNGQGYGLGQSLIEIKQSKYFILETTVRIGEEYSRTGLSLLKREGGGTQGQNPTAGQQSQVNVRVVRRTDANF